MIKALQSMFTIEGLAMVLILLALLLYIRFLRRSVRRKQETQKAVSGNMSDTELERYARHIVLRELGGQGQQRLRNAKVLVIGAGGLGAPVLSYLAAAGVGRIGVIDDDVVSLSNLQRQVIFGESHLDMPKVFAVQQVIEDQNPFVEIRPYQRKFTQDIAHDLIADYDLVIDTSDDFKTRLWANQAAVGQGKPMIFGAVAQWEGQVSVFDEKNGACFACLFPDEPADGLAPNCAEAGIVGALPGVIGSMMALEAIKYIAKTGENLTNRLMIYDGLGGNTQIMRFAKNPDCPVCGSHS